MKIILASFLFSLSAFTFSQNKHIEIQQDLLAERTDLGAWEVSAQQASLDNSLSASLKDRVRRSSGPYAIANMGDIKALIDSEKSRLYPALNLSLPTFKGRKPLALNIDSIATRMEREILRGQVVGVKGSKVKLVVHEGQMSGRIIFPDSNNIIVIRSIEGGTIANYEVDTSGITYD